MQVDTLTPPGAVWWPDRRTLDNANLTRFMRALGVDSFEALNARASADPAWFDEALIRFLDYRFQQPYAQVLDLSQGLPFARWCVGGTTNVVLNCINRQRDTPRYTQAALIWEGEDGSVSSRTFADLDRETCRLAWGLRRLGLGRGVHLRPARRHRRQQRGQDPVGRGGRGIGRRLSSSQGDSGRRLAAHAQHENDAPRGPRRLAGR